MSIIKALQEYISGYKDMDLIVLTDRVSEDINTYALYPTGNGKIKSDMLGNKTYQRSYMFLAKKPTFEEFERQENYDFLEGFCDWVENNNDNGIYPYLGDNTEVESLEVANIMLMDISETFDTGVYQIQINLIYTKENY